ncbi:hypothetical protein GLOTRDRAFT_65283 [Gloeophyllum trabeum ATCC 11539]|uniref:Major royal jelly protein n=1 Tax=Gloeophyllum trabeum (strain ATCC 11539 / FP-39264 / Madison 617) TaxID=670483 RepID=S7RGL1_GLOTA|nr:uncharacterized protein GLOTRDRAFT_65283 [Gloeophyllum trabeum ATCC 11539]EPQ51699.1 hypothetical protein GLOTRDRAFT_65283 [Gloeophyllum trabeum ATCC 11539]
MMNVALATALSLAAGGLAWLTDPFQVYDNGTYGPPLQVEHLFYDQWPTGLSVASNGAIYANFPTAVNQTNTQYTVGVVTSYTTEAAFPSVEYNQPPGGFLNPSNPAFGSADPDHLISVQSVVVDALDRVWALDTGRPLYNGAQVLATVPGGPKLVGFYQNGTRFANYVLPITTAYPDTYLNDVRFDLRPSTLPSGQGVAYITDSSDEGRSGIIVIDLGTGNSWRHIDSQPYTRGDQGFISTYDGQVFQPIRQGNPNPGTYSHLTTGSDGIALSADGAYLYFSPLSSRRLYRVPTSYLLVQPSGANPNAANAAIAATQYLGEMGGSHADGMETDASGVIYIGAPEQDGITMYHPDLGMWMPFVRDPRIQWPDTLSVATNNRLYFTSNQYWLQPSLNNGTEYRVRPWGIFSVPISAGKVILT